MHQRNRTVSSVIADILIYSLIGLFTIICLYPFWYMLIFTVSDPNGVIEGVYFIPKGFSLFNIRKVLGLNGIGQALLISVLRTVIGTFATVLSCSFLAYLFTKEEMPFRKLVYRFLIITMYVNGGLISTYLIIKAYGLFNNFLVYILPGIISAYYVILIKTFIESLSASLEESAVIDGAGYVRVFRSIIIPLSKPIIATIAVFAAVAHWNSWFDTNIYISSTNSNLFTLQFLLYKFLNEASRIAQTIKNSTNMNDVQAAIKQQLTPKGVRMTITLLVTIPVFLIYPFAQRYFVKGIMVGAIKG